MKKQILFYVICALSIFYSMCQAIVMIIDHPGYWLFLLLATIMQIIAGFAGMEYFSNNYQNLKNKEDER